MVNGGSPPLTIVERRRWAVIAGKYEVVVGQSERDTWHLACISPRRRVSVRGCGQPSDDFYCYSCKCQECGCHLINGIWEARRHSQVECPMIVHSNQRIWTYALSDDMANL
ncbi:hypothetical protein Tco_0335299 [Tanacetum coccineum]